MKHRFIPGLVIYVVLSSAGLLQAEDLSGRVELALSRAGRNAAQIRKALNEIPDSQKEGMQFLVAYMPERDLQSLSADFLINDVKYAYRAWDEAPWKGQIPQAIFLNDILPYASINERRDDWREDFFRRFKPLVAETTSPGEAVVKLNQEIFKMLNVCFSRNRPKAEQSPYETIEAGMASCTGLSVLLIDACRAVGIPARLAGTPLWTDKSGNHSWVEIWDGDWHYTGGAEPDGDRLDKAWFTNKAATAQRDHRLHAIYAASYQQTELIFPLAWNQEIDYIYAVNVTDRYAKPEQNKKEMPSVLQEVSGFDVEASLHAVDQLKKYLQTPRPDRTPLADHLFASVPLTRKDSEQARQLLWEDHVSTIQEARREEMTSRHLTIGELTLPFYYRVNGNKPENGRSLFISLHGGGGAPKEVNDSQWNNQKKLYRIEEGVYLAPRSPNDAWDMWHQQHIDGMFDRLIENMIVFEGVNPNRVYLLGYSAGGDGVYRLAPRMADRWAAASMMAGHPGDASPVNLYNTPFTIHVGENDSAYNRNQIAGEWGQKLDEFQKKEPAGYIHWTKIYEDKGHWVDNGAAEALPWMAQYTRNPLPKDIIWRQDKHKRFYWLATEKVHLGAIVRGILNGQTIELHPGGVDELLIRVNDQMLNLDEDVIVTSEGEELFRGRIKRSIAVLAQTLAERGDPTSILSGQILVVFNKDSVKSPDLVANQSHFESKTLAPEIAVDPRPFVMPKGYICRRVLGPITVDGKLDEESWQKAEWTDPHVDIEGQMRPVTPRYETRTKMLWDDTYFYVGARLKDPHIWATITKRNAVIFNDNDFEVFIDPDGDSHNYFEFEMNAFNAVWNLFLEKPYKHGGSAVIQEMPGQKSGVFVQGTRNDPGDVDDCWTVEIAFPWKAMETYAGCTCPPSDGDQWRVNFSRVEWRHTISDNTYVRVPPIGQTTKEDHEDNWIWSPQGVINMHRPETWGYVQFSNCSVGSPVDFMPDPSASVRYLLHRVLYAQEAYKLHENRYAETLEELKLGNMEAPSLAEPIILISDSKTYKAEAKVKLTNGKIQTINLYDNGRIYVIF